MIRRSDFTVSDSLNTPEPGVHITVKDDTGALATLYDDSGNLIANPFLSGLGGAFTYNIADGDAGTFTEEFRLNALESPRKIQPIDLSLNAVSVRYASTRTALALMSTALPVQLTESGREGLFVWSSANLQTQVTADTAQGLYVPPAGGNGSTGAWVRKFKGPHNARWFGATGDGVTNDSAAVLAALAYLGATSQSGFGYSSSTAELFFPKGHYYLGTSTLELTYTVILTGEGTGAAGGGSSVLRWAANTTGIRTQRTNTTGATAIQAASGHGGDGSLIRNLYLKGGFSTAEGEYHGIQLRATAIIRDVFIENFQGDGIYVKATIGGGAGSEGAANLVEIDKVFVQTCRNGLYFEGADANACSISSFSAIACRQWGVWDKSFLGNTYFAPHAASNGRVAFNTGGASNPTSFASQGGNRYVCISGQEAGASTNAPTGAATNNTWWIYVEAGGATTGIPAWTNGITVRAGGAYLVETTSNATTLVNPYGEIDQYSQFDQNTSILGNGFLQGHIKVSGGVATANRLASVGASLNGHRFLGNIEALGDANLKSSNNFIGPTTGTVSDTTIQFNTTNTTTILRSYNWPAGTSSGEIWLGYSGIGGNLHRATFKHRFDIGVGEIVGIDSSGLNIASGAALLFNGTVLTSTANGRLLAAAIPIFTGDVTSTGGSLALSLSSATVVSKIGAQAIAPASVAASGGITSSGGGLGYATGAGGTVTQATSKATGVTLNKLCGEITLNAASLAASTVVSFVLTNSQIAAGDNLILNHVAGGTFGGYAINGRCAAGSATIDVRNLTAGALLEAIVIRFTVLKGVTA